MIDVLKDDTIINMLGGRFKLTALMQKRWVELMQGARPTIEAGNKSELEIIVQEILEGKIAADLGAMPGVPEPLTRGPAA
jgi:DNA-directed RNA polymerase subunit omega